MKAFGNNGHLGRLAVNRMQPAKKKNLMTGYPKVVTPERFNRGSIRISPGFPIKTSKIFAIFDSRNRGSIKDLNNESVAP